MDIPALTPREFFIAAQIVNRGAMRPTAIETAAGGMITRGGLAKILFMMERRGLIEKTSHPAAGRQTLISLTTHGRQAWADFLDWTTCRPGDGVLTRPRPWPGRPAAGRARSDG